MSGTGLDSRPSCLAARPHDLSNVSDKLPERQLDPENDEPVCLELYQVL